MEARPPAKNRHGGAPRGAPPSAEGGRHPRKVPGPLRYCGPRVSADTRRLSALRPPLDRGGERSRLGRIAPRERDGLFDIVEMSCRRSRRYCLTVSPPRRAGQRDSRSPRFRGNEPKSSLERPEASVLAKQTHRRKSADQTQRRQFGRPKPPKGKSAERTQLAKSAERSQFGAARRCATRGRDSTGERAHA